MELAGTQMKLSTFRVNRDGGIDDSDGVVNGMGRVSRYVCLLTIRKIKDIASCPHQGIQTDQASRTR